MDSKAQAAADEIDACLARVLSADAYLKAPGISELTTIISSYFPITDQSAEIQRLTKLLDDAHVRNAEDQDEHSEQRAVLAKEVEQLKGEVDRLTKEISEAYYQDCEICEQLIVSANGDEVYTFAVCGRCWNETQKRLATTRADAIGEAIARLSQFGREVRKVDAITALKSLV